VPPRGVLPFVLQQWPFLRRLLPESLSAIAFRHWNTYVEVHTTHAALFRPEWQNPEEFSFARLQEPFFAVGVVSTDYERLLLLWARGGRRFFFQDAYLTFAATHYPTVSQRLQNALSAWEQSRELFVGQSGGLRIKPDMLPARPGEEEEAGGARWERVGLMQPMGAVPLP
jgi:hypothetical protein